MRCRGSAGPNAIAIAHLAMKLQADRIDGQNAISRHGPDGVIVNGVEHRRSVIVPWAGPVLQWQADAFLGLNEAHFAEDRKSVV